MWYSRQIVGADRASFFERAHEILLGLLGHANRKRASYNEQTLIIREFLFTEYRKPSLVVPGFHLLMHILIFDECLFKVYTYSLKKIS